MQIDNIVARTMLGEFRSQSQETANMDRSQALMPPFMGDGHAGEQRDEHFADELGEGINSAARWLGHSIVSTVVAFFSKVTSGAQLIRQWVSAVRQPQDEFDDREEFSSNGDDIVEEVVDPMGVRRQLPVSKWIHDSQFEVNPDEQVTLDVHDQNSKLFNDFEDWYIAHHGPRVPPTAIDSVIDIDDDFD